MDIMTFLKDWLAKHIRETDKNTHPSSTVREFNKNDRMISYRIIILAKVILYVFAYFAAKQVNRQFKLWRIANVKLMKYASKNDHNASDGQSAISSIW
jgi:hypothetical protein